VVTTVELSDTMQPGHLSLPNGLGLDYPDDTGAPVLTGVAPNELTSSDERDWLAGTPHHKHVKARVSAVVTEDIAATITDTSDTSDTSEVIPA
jgi:hypothetical protein